MARKTIHSTGGFWLILGALLLAASLRLLFWAAVAAAVHELGHVAAVRALGGGSGCFPMERSAWWRWRAPPPAFCWP